MIEKILIFIVFLCPLIFFHELGHFLFARLFGVRVETFSIGFGPKLLKFIRNGTEYTISLIPLGGYVKMFGDDPYKEEEISEEEKKYAFNYKGKWARFWIVFGGPLANFILAYFIFVGILVSGEKVPEPKFGNLAQESFLYKNGARVGDRLTKINGVPFLNLMDLELSENEIVKTVEINRGGQAQVIKIGKTFEDFMKEFFSYPPHFRKPLLTDRKGNYYGVSLQSGQLDFKTSLEEMVDTGHAKHLYLYRLKKPWVSGVDSQKEIDADPSTEMKIVIEGINGHEFFKDLVSKGFYPLDLKVLKVLKDSPAEKAGLKDGDLITNIENVNLVSFEHLRSTLQSFDKDKFLYVSYYRNDKLHTVRIHPDVVSEDDKNVLKLGVYSKIEFLPLSYIHTEGKGIIDGLYFGFGRTWDAFYKTVIGFKKLISNEVSLKSVGGPIAIGKVASDSFSIGLSYFFKIMAIISVNLGIINLFPIPVLDGGHIFFIMVEALNRGPLSRRKMEIAQQIGLSLLILLIFLSLFNDLSKLFGF